MKLPAVLAQRPWLRHQKPRRFETRAHECVPLLASAEARGADARLLGNSQPIVITR